MDVTGTRKVGAKFQCINCTLFILFDLHPRLAFIHPDIERQPSFKIVSLATHTFRISFRLKKAVIDTGEHTAGKRIDMLAC